MGESPPDVRGPRSSLYSDARTRAARPAGRTVLPRTSPRPPSQCVYAPNMDVLDQPGASAPTDPTAVTAASAARPTRSSRRQLALRRELTKLAGQIRPRWRGWIHAGAFPLSIVGGLALVIVSPTIASRIAAALFTLTGMLLFGTSAVYHAGRWRLRIRLPPH